MCSGDSNPGSHICARALPTVSSQPSKQILEPLLWVLDGHSVLILDDMNKVLNRGSHSCWFRWIDFYRMNSWFYKWAASASLGLQCFGQNLCTESWGKKGSSRSDYTILVLEFKIKHRWEEKCLWLVLPGEKTVILDLTLVDNAFLAMFNWNISFWEEVWE